MRKVRGTVGDGGASLSSGAGTSGKNPGPNVDRAAATTETVSSLVACGALLMIAALVVEGALVFGALPLWPWLVIDGLVWVIAFLLVLLGAAVHG